jgi:Protein kinase domain
MPMLSLPTGSTIGGYRIEELAGQGGMGVVYRATQLSLGRPVALKLISPGLAEDTRFRERFQRESRLTASIDHPNVIPLYEAGAAEDALFIAMRWVPGSTLETLIKRGGGVEPERAVAIVAQVAAALDAAHAHGLLHRDVKPANVLIADGPGGHVYLTDFGLVKRIGTGAHLTRTGQLLGTIDYIAPEQIRGEDLDKRADVYSLGCVLFHALAGRVPFETDDEIAKVYAHLSEPAPRPSDVVAALPAALDDVVARAMAKEPADRFQTAGALGRAAFAAVDATQQQRSTMRATAAAVARRHRRPRRSGALRRAWLALGAATVIAVAAALAAAIVEDGGAPAGDSVDRPAPLPQDGELLRAQGGETVWVMKAGAKFPLNPDERRAFSYRSDAVHEVRREELLEIPSVPRDGTLVRSQRSTVVWAIRGGTRHLAAPPAGADVTVIPRLGLPQIPLPTGGRMTSVTVDAPAFIVKGQSLRLSARVHGRAGEEPRGRCLFYRLTPTGLEERANTPTRAGACTADLRVSRLGRVRYSVHFIGRRGWRPSQATARSIRVLPN